MAKRTKKVGSAGRLGARYGVKIRRRIADIESQGRKRHDCPKCRSKAVTRDSTGIWTCRHCGSKMASSAYSLTAPASVKREVKHVPTGEGEEELPSAGEGAEGEAQ
ncbi:MAG: 50S ribosomal protein L37Ae [Methanobacteriota archaeon]|nr:MAG: 50S ribosomal protein L37Ae [Euryarchaeota archaeon]